MFTKIRVSVFSFVSVFAVFSSMPLVAAGADRTRVSVETDPSTFALGGYAGHLRVSPAGLEHWVLGLGVYSMTFPDAMVDTNTKNKNEGWDVRLRQGLGLFGEYYFDPSNQGWFVGGQLAHHDFRLKNANVTPGSQDFSNILLMAHGGYRWFPFNSGFYVQPWMGVGYTSKVSGNATLGSATYDISPIMPFATLHLGYRF